MCQWLMIWFAVHYVTPWVDVVFPSLFSGMSYFFTRLIISSKTVFSTKSISAASSRFYIIVCLDRLPTCLRFLVSIFSEWFRLRQKWLLIFFFTGTSWFRTGVAKSSKAMLLSEVFRRLARSTTHFISGSVFNEEMYMIVNEYQIYKRSHGNFLRKPLLTAF